MTDHNDVTGDRPASIRDVARHAGVSYQTVSRVLNDHENVRATTRTRVRASITALGYRPSEAARALVSGRSSTLTVLTSDTTLYGYRSSLRGIEAAARERGLAVVVSVLASAEPGVVEAAVERVSDPRSGSVVVIAFDEAGVRALAALPPEVPTAALVESGYDAPDPGGRHTWLDDRAVAAQATAHLLGLGHRTVHHLPIPSGAAVGERQAGWADALRHAGVTVPPLLSEPGWDLAAGYRAGRAVAADRTVTAVLCGNDDLAVGLMRALHEHGLRVPHDVSVIGFDDTPQAAYLTPSLTTVRMDFTALGRRAVALLHTGEPPPVPLPSLVVRESVGPPSSGPDRNQ